MNHGLLPLALLAFAASCFAAPAPDPLPPLDNTNYRLEVEAVIEPSHTCAIFRIRVWTKEKRKVSLHLNDQQTTTECPQKIDPVTKLYRSEMVIIAALERPADGNPQINEHRQMIYFGSSGVSRSNSTIVPRSTMMKEVADVQPQVGVHKLGRSCEIGQLWGGKAHVQVVE